MWPDRRARKAVASVAREIVVKVDVEFAIGK